MSMRCSLQGQPVERFNVAESAGTPRKLIYEIAFIESALDDPEHISLDGYPERLRETLQPIEMELEASIGTFDNGRIMTEGSKP